MFENIRQVEERLRDVGYLADTSTATSLFLATRLDKPLLVEGPAGVGKTELAKAATSILERHLVRLQCYEGVDEAKALYEWNYKKQLLRIQAGERERWDDLTGDIFSEEFLLERPVLRALRAEEATVLLIDEIDKLDVEAEALLLEVLADWQVTIPEMGTVTANHKPLVILTSNSERDLSEALKRRCLYLYIGYPSAERELEIVRNKVPDIAPELAREVVRVVASIRELDLKKPPSIAETIDWARTLVHLAIEDLDDDTTRATLPVLVKFQSDIERTAHHLGLAGTRSS